MGKPIMTNEIIITSDTKPVESPVTATLALIERMVSDPLVDVDKLERMLSMQERIMGKQAEMEFNQALSRVAEKMPRIVKGKSVSYKETEAFKYATYEDIDKAVRPLLIEEGMSLSFSTEIRDGGGIVVIGTLSHRNGHFRTAAIPVPLDTSGGKNNVQGMGSSFAYGKRYTMCMLLNIVTVGEDDDGQGGPITDEQAAELKAGLKESGLDVKKFLATLKAESVEQIRTRDYLRAKTAIDAKLYRNLQEEEKKKGKPND
jgi:hypothetical protein